MKALSLFGLFLLVHATALASPLTVGGTVHDAHCGGNDGGIEPYVSGGQPPYTYSWSTGSTEPYLINLTPGSYTLTVTDAASTTANGFFTVNNVSGLFTEMPAQDGHVNCPGHCWGEFQILPQYLGGTPPYTYSLPVAGIDGDGDPYFQIPGGACGTDTYDLQISDAAGCSGTMHVTIFEPMFGTHMQATAVQGSCTGGTGGSTTITQVYDGNFFTTPQFTVTDGQGNWADAVVGAIGLSVNVSHLAPGHYVAHRDWNFFYQYTAYACDDDTLGFDIPDLGVACGTVSGTVYIDHDGSCSQDVADPSVPNTLLHLMPDDEYMISDANGHYERDLVDGSYTLQQVSMDLIQLCPAASPVPFTLAGGASIINFADSGAVLQDVQALAGTGVAVPGFVLTEYVAVKNVGFQLSGAITATLTFDPALTYAWSSVTPASITGNVISWDLPTLNAYGQQTVQVQFNVPVSVPLGTVLYQEFNVHSDVTELDPSNNDVVFTSTVVGSFDPNDKTVQTNVTRNGQVFFLNTDEYMDYTIRFQNTGTASANVVVVTDTLSDLLDMGTFQQGVASHPFSVSFKPGHVVEWRFDNIQLPDSGSDEANSHGLVTFRIWPKEPVLPGNVISNNADIFFDFNTPVRTNNADLLVEIGDAVKEVGAEHLALHPNPASEQVQVTTMNDMRRVELWASDGRVVQHSDVRGTSAMLDVHALAPGLYTVQVLLQDGSVQRGRLVKR